MNEPKDLTFTNPRLEAKIENWPVGGNRRGLCIFEVQHNPRFGYRVARLTERSTGDFSKPKVTAYGGKAAIVDGSDGRIYILQRAGDFILIWQSNFLLSQFQLPQHATLAALIEEANR